MSDIQSAITSVFAVFSALWSFISNNPVLVFAVASPIVIGAFVAVVRAIR